MVARHPFAFLANGDMVRGRMGMVLHNRYPEVYRSLFRPRVSSGPSGLLDSPRPFVLRLRHLDRVMVERGQRYEIGMNLFETRQPPIDILRDCLASGIAADCVEVQGRELLQVKLAADRPVERVRVRFLTPTELKPVDRPEFGVLFARIRDRVSTLRALYGAGPLHIDFQEMGKRAAAIRMTRCELEHVEAARWGHGPESRHSLGGFAGVAEYEGALGEFVPYLEAARWTGVGRQTVWGKGEIGWETF